LKHWSTSAELNYKTYAAIIGDYFTKRRLLYCEAGKMVAECNCSHASWWRNCPCLVQVKLLLTVGCLQTWLPPQILESENQNWKTFKAFSKIWSTFWIEFQKSMNKSMRPAMSQKGSINEWSILPVKFHQIKKIPAFQNWLNLGQVFRVFRRYCEKVLLSLGNPHAYI
jgi:hypothetical protein